MGAEVGRLTTHSILPQSAEVITSLEAGGLQVLVQAALDRGQATYASSNYCHFLDHGVLCVKVEKNLCMVVLEENP